MSATRLVLVKNNAYDTVCLLDGSRVMGAWAVDARVARDYLAGEPELWEPNYPECERVSDYGEEIVDETAIQERIAWYLR